jgi:TPR repeat protein
LAADGGHAEAQCRLGKSYDYGEFDPKGFFDLDVDLDQVIEWYRKAADGVRAKAQQRLGEAYVIDEFGLEVNMNHAFEWYRKAAYGDRADYSELHEYGSCARLGDAHEHGQIGLEVDMEKAFKGYRKMAYGDTQPPCKVCMDRNIYVVIMNTTSLLGPLTHTHTHTRHLNPGPRHCCSDCSRRRPAHNKANAGRL